MRALRYIQDIDRVTARKVVGPRIQLFIDRQKGHQIPSHERHERGIHDCEAMLFDGLLDEHLDPRLPLGLSFGEDGVDVGCGDLRRARRALEHGCEVRGKDSSSFDGAVASLARNWPELESRLVSQDRPCLVNCQ